MRSTHSMQVVTYLLQMFSLYSPPTPHYDGMISAKTTRPPVSGSLASTTRLHATLAVVTLLAASPVRAQATSAPVRIQVRDSAGHAALVVDLRIVRGLNVTVAAGTTDSLGRAVLSVPTAPAEYQLELRKIGYGRTERFFRVGRDSLSFDVTLRRVIQQLETVKVTAEQDVKRKSYHVDADQIAGSTELLRDATDVLAKLRPDMICGRSCSPMASIAAITRNPARKCPGLVFQQRQPMSCPVDDTPPSVLTNVWVNGRRIRSVALNEMVRADVIDGQTGTRAQPTGTGTLSLILLPNGGSLLRISKAGDDNLSRAVEISPEHTTPITLMMTRMP